LPLFSGISIVWAIFIHAMTLYKFNNGYNFLTMTKDHLPQSNSYSAKIVFQTGLLMLKQIKLDLTDLIFTIILLII
jgi:hypothetical protein